MLQIPVRFNLQQLETTFSRRGSRQLHVGVGECSAAKLGESFSYMCPSIPACTLSVNAHNDVCNRKCIYRTSDSRVLRTGHYWTLPASWRFLSFVWRRWKGGLRSVTFCAVECAAIWHDFSCLRTDVSSCTCECWGYALLLSYGSTLVACISGCSHSCLHWICKCTWVDVSIFTCVNVCERTRTQNYSSVDKIMCCSLITFGQCQRLENCWIVPQGAGRVNCVQMLQIPVWLNA